MNYREENDTMGTVRIPEDAYYGPQTQRAKENFSISGLLLPTKFIGSLALIKQCCAKVNARLGLLNDAVSAHIIDVFIDVQQQKF